MKTKGISFIEGLQLLFIAFQLAGVIVWPWWCVALPMIIKFALTFIINAMESAEKKRLADKKTLQDIMKNRAK